MISIYKTNPIDCSINNYKEQSFLNNELKKILRAKNKKKFLFIYAINHNGISDIIGINK